MRGTGNRFQKVLAIACLALAAGGCGGTGSDEAGPDGPRRLALLIGVSDYERLPPERDLLGPANDVRLFRELLIERGFAPADITVLADGVDDGARPTRGNILAQWDALAADSRAGDFLFLFYAGHGSQQPTGGADEADGLEEIILPADIGGWDGSLGKVENAITDNEIGRFLARYTASGASAWAVFDACHSATLTRAEGVAGERQRYLDPVAELGVPADGLPLRAHLERFEVDDPLPSLDRVTAFFAAASTEPTPELRLPAGHAERRYHGLFSFTLARALRARPNASYRDLADTLLADYAAQNRRSPSPEFGGALDAPVFAGGDAVTTTWAARRDSDRAYRIGAGALHGLSPGARLELHPTGDPALAILLEVSDAGLHTSLARVLGPPDVMLPDGGVVRLLAPAVDLALDVCRPADPGVGQLLAKAAAGAPRLRVVDSECDVAPVVEGDWLWLADPAGRVPAVPDASHELPRVPADDSAALRDVLDRIGRARALFVAAAGARGDVRGFSLHFERLEPGENAPLASPVGASLAHGDRIRLRVRNDAQRPLDVTALFVDSHYRVAALWPTADASNRLDPGEAFEWRGTVDTSETRGRERLVVIAARGALDRAPLDFRFLADGGAVPVSRAGEPLFDLFRLAASGDAIRGLAAGSAAEAEVRILSWYARETLPP